MRAEDMRPDLPPVLRLAALLAVALLQPGCNAACEPPADTAADYDDPDSWLCHPDLAEDECSAELATVEVLPDNLAQPLQREIADDPGFDCFYVYPTVDLRLRSTLHSDLSDDADEAAVVRTQAARFAEVCAVWAPRYRQVTIGTYIGREEAVQPCFDTAFEHVERAIDAWLAAADPDRGVLLVGHSQGGQIVSRLLRERFDGDPALRDRLVGAMPIGWAVGTDTGDVLGGSSDEVPVCTASAESSCLVAFRSYGAGNDAPEPGDRYAEGDAEVCVHPGDVSGGGPELLAGAVFRLGDGQIVDLPDGIDTGSADYVVYRDFFEATCHDDEPTGLEVRAAPGEDDARGNPVPFDSALLSGSSGTHVLDVQFAMLDLVARAGAMGDAWSARR